MPESHIEAVIAALATPTEPKSETQEKPEVGGVAPNPVATPETAPKTTDKGVDANVPDPTKPDPKKKDDNKPEPAAKPKEGEQPPADDEQPYGLTPEQVTDPKIKPLVQAADDLQKLKDLFVEGYSIPLEDQEGKPLPIEKVMEAVRLERTDAHMLYDIIAGRRNVGDLLGLVANLRRGQDGKLYTDSKLGYSKEVAEQIYSKTIDFLAEIGFVQSYLTANGLSIVKAGTPAPASTEIKSDDPNTKRIANLEGELAKQQTAERQRQQAEEARKVSEHRTTVEKSFVDKVTELCTKKGLDASLLNSYIKGVSDQVNGQPAVLQRIAKGNWVDVNRYFTTFHNQMLEQAKKYGQSISTTKTSIQKQVPNSPAGGGAPAATTPTKRSFAKSEDRVAAVADMLKNPS